MACGSERGHVLAAFVQQRQRILGAGEIAVGRLAQPLHACDRIGWTAFALSSITARLNWATRWLRSAALRKSRCAPVRSPFGTPPSPATVPDVSPGTTCSRAACAHSAAGQQEHRQPAEQGGRRIGSAGSRPRLRTTLPAGGASSSLGGLTKKRARKMPSSYSTTQRDREQQLRQHVGRRENGRDDERADDHVGPRLLQLFDAGDAEPYQQHDDDRHLEGQCRTRGTCP